MLLMVEHEAKTVQLRLGSRDARRLSESGLRESPISPSTIRRYEMIILRSGEQVTQGPLESDSKDEKGAHWFYSVPCAGVTYYAFEEAPTPPVRVNPRASDQTTDRDQ